MSPANTHAENARRRPHLMRGAVHRTLPGLGSGRPVKRVQKLRCGKNVMTGLFIPPRTSTCVSFVTKTHETNGWIHTPACPPGHHSRQCQLSRQKLRPKSREPTVIAAYSSSNLGPAGLRVLTPANPATPAPERQAQEPMADSPSLVDVVARLAAEVSGPLTEALDRVNLIASHGRIDRQGLVQLTRAIEEARRAGLMGQRIARMANGQARPGIERVDLGGLLQDALNQLTVRAAAGASGHRVKTTRAQVMGDASLLHTVVEAAASWAQELAQGSIEWTLEADPWPPTASLHCRFSRPEPATGESTLSDARDSLNWLMLGHATQLAGVAVSHSSLGQRQLLTLKFRHLANQDDGESAAGHDAMLNSRSGTRALLTGCQVLVLTTQRDWRQRVRDALRGQEVFVDHVATVAAAEHYCDDGAPQVLVYESAFDGDALRRLRQRLGHQAQPAALVELVPDSHECRAAGREVHLGMEALASSLAPALVMALARGR